MRSGAGALPLLVLSAGVVRQVAALQAAELAGSTRDTSHPEAAGVPSTRHASEVTSANADSDIVDGYPSQPGCYVRMPSGCPSSPKKTRRWRRDRYADGHRFNKWSCNMRKRKWDYECGTDDVKMLFIGNATGSADAASHGEAAEDKSGSMVALQLPPSGARLSGGARLPPDETVIIGYPSLPGCYMRFPSGCPKAPKKTRMWRHDIWAEQRGLGREACRERKHKWDSECGVEDVKIMFIGNGTDMPQAAQSDRPEVRGHPATAAQRKESQESQPQLPTVEPSLLIKESQLPAGFFKRDALDSDPADRYPSQPGCYLQLSSGCPGNLARAAQSRFNGWEEQRGLGQHACKLRRRSWGQECGVEDVKMVFIA